MINLVKLFIISLVFLSIPASALSTEIEKKSGDWEYYTESDDLDNTQKHIAATGGSSKAGKLGAFAIGCEKVGGKVYASYFPGRYVGKSMTRETTYRVDEKKPVSQEWFLHDKLAMNVNLPVEEVKAMIDALITGKKLIIRVYDHEYEPVRHTFSLHGAGQAIGHVLRGCKG